MVSSQFYNRGAGFRFGILSNQALSIAYNNIYYSLSDEEVGHVLLDPQKILKM